MFKSYKHKFFLLNDLNNDYVDFAGQEQTRE